MKKWWNWILVLTLVSLLFVAIPLTYPKSKTKEELRPMFDSYIQKFNKSYKYNLTEYEARLEHFCDSVREIEALNSASKGPEQLRAQYGLTKLSDLSKAEFQEIHLSDEKPHHTRNRRRNWSKKKLDKNGMDYKEVYTITDHDDDEIHKPYDKNNILIRKQRAAIPLRVDWREKGVIGPVRDQGLCGACWAFSTVGTMEAMAAIDTGKLTTLSVQEVIDCAGLGNSGCLGGDICLLLDWLTITDTPVQPEKEYPLKLTNGVCHKKANATGVRVKTFTCDDLIGSEDKILQLIATHGPVSVAVNALTWQNYLGGVIQFHCSGNPMDLNHAVELVGYDISADVPYYIAKNSWGKMFGTDGYILLAIGNNICGLANEVASIDIKP